MSFEFGGIDNSFESGLDKISTNIASAEDAIVDLTAGLSGNIDGEGGLTEFMVESSKQSRVVQANTDAMGKLKEAMQQTSRAVTK